VDINHQRIGTHNGLHLFTVGQRRGIHIPAAEPYYVVRILPEENTVVVGFKFHVFTSRCRVSAINWIASPPLTPMHVDIQVRYRHRAVPGDLIPLGPDTASIIFESPQAAITPGQGAVFYREDEVLGGGWIDRE
jgi:tRNA-specific 2-thiouridylase